MCVRVLRVCARVSEWSGASECVCVYLCVCVCVFVCACVCVCVLYVLRVCVCECSGAECVACVARVA